MKWTGNVKRTRNRCARASLVGRHPTRLSPSMWGSCAALVRAASATQPPRRLHERLCWSHFHGPRLVRRRSLAQVGPSPLASAAPAIRGTVRYPRHLEAGTRFRPFGGTLAAAENVAARTATPESIPMAFLTPFGSGLPEEELHLAVGRIEGVFEQQPDYVCAGHIQPSRSKLCHTSLDALDEAVGKPKRELSCRCFVCHAVLPPQRVACVTQRRPLSPRHEECQNGRGHNPAVSRAIRWNSLRRPQIRHAERA